MDYEYVGDDLIRISLKHFFGKFQWVLWVIYFSKQKGLLGQVCSKGKLSYYQPAWIKEFFKQLTPI